MSSNFPGLTCFPAEMFSLWRNLLIVSLFSRFSFSFSLFLFVPNTSEGHGRLLEVGGALRTAGTHRDTNPQPLLHPGGGLPVHRPALQQRPDGQRGKRSVWPALPCPSESWMRIVFLPKPSLITSALLPCSDEGTIVLEQWTLSDRFNPFFSAGHFCGAF